MIRINSLRKILMVLLLGMAVNVSWGQACGIYIVGYVGELDGGSMEILAITFPSTNMLEGRSKRAKDREVRIGTIDGRKFAFSVMSPLGAVPKNVDWLFDLYKANNPFLELTITAKTKEGRVIKQKIALDWDPIRYIGAENEKDPFITLDLGTIRL